jgi:ribosome-binding factor A
MTVERTDRLNSLLKEVISEVIRKEVRNPLVSELFTVTRVAISKDLRHAKVYISVIGTKEQKEQTVVELNRSSGFIARLSSKKVVLRYFPDLVFYLDDSLEKHMRIEDLLSEIAKEKSQRPSVVEDDTSQS